MTNDEKTGEQAQQESTDKLYWAVEQIGYVIHGIGKTQEEATEDAVRWLDEYGDSDELREELEENQYKSLFIGDLRWVRITPALYDAVEEDGGDIPHVQIDWDFPNQRRPVLDVIEEED